MDNDLNLDKEYSADEIFKILSDSSSDDFLKIFSIINITKIDTQDEFNNLISHLINHPTPIREIVSYKLIDINETKPIFFDNDFTKEIILKAIIDINPNVSRNICALISQNEFLKIKLETSIINKIESLINNIDDYQNNNKNHSKNKKLFALYWYLEALSICISQKYNEKILNFINKTINFSDYTIREKTAKIIMKLNPSPTDLIKKVKLDQNFYVKNQVYDKIIDEID